MDEEAWTERLGKVHALALAGRALMQSVVLPPDQLANFTQEQVAHLAGAVVALCELLEQVERRHREAAPSRGGEPQGPPEGGNCAT